MLLINNVKLIVFRKQTEFKKLRNRNLAGKIEQARNLWNTLAEIVNETAPHVRNLIVKFFHSSFADNALYYKNRNRVPPLLVCAVFVHKSRFLCLIIVLQNHLSNVNLERRD